MRSSIIVIASSSSGGQVVNDEDDDEAGKDDEEGRREDNFASVLQAGGGSDGCGWFEWAREEREGKTRMSVLRVGTAERSSGLGARGRSAQATGSEEERDEERGERGGGERRGRTLLEKTDVGLGRLYFDQNERRPLALVIGKRLDESVPETPETGQGRVCQ